VAGIVATYRTTKWCCRLKPAASPPSRSS